MIVDVIERIAQQMSNRFDFFHAVISTANQKADKIARPLIYLDADIPYTLSAPSQTGRISEVYSCVIMFLTPVPFTASPEQRRPVMADMIKASKEFVMRLNKDREYVKSITQAAGTMSFNRFDNNMDGVALRLQIELTDAGFDYCLTSYDTEYELSAGSPE